MKDKYLLDKLTELGGPNGLKWTCRWSTTGRGLRLHQMGSRDGDDVSAPVFDTPREAIENFLKNRKAGES